MKTSVSPGGAPPFVPQKRPFLTLKPFPSGAISRYCQYQTVCCAPRAVTSSWCVEIQAPLGSQGPALGATPPSLPVVPPASFVPLPASLPVALLASFPPVPPVAPPASLPPVAPVAPVVPPASLLPVAPTPPVVPPPGLAVAPASTLLGAIDASNHGG